MRRHRLMSYNGHITWTGGRTDTVYTNGPTRESYITAPVLLLHGPTHSLDALAYTLHNIAMLHVKMTAHVNFSVADNCILVASICNIGCLEACDNEPM